MHVTTLPVFFICTACCKLSHLQRAHILQGRSSHILIGPAKSLPSPAFPSPSHPLPLVPSLPFLPRPLEVGSLFVARGSGGALKLPQRVRAEPGRQTPSGAFSAYPDAFFGKHFHASCLLKLGSGSPCTEIDKTSVAAGSSHNTAASYHRQFIYYIRHSVLLPHSH